MKRGKRQVLQPTGLEKNQQEISYQPQGKFIANLANTQSLRSTDTYSFLNTNQPARLQTKTHVQPVKQEATVKGEEMDQKKRKIQLLKQKYLKKNKPEQPKDQPAMVQKEIKNFLKQQTLQKTIQAPSKPVQFKKIVQMPTKQVALQPQVEIKLQNIPQIIQDKDLNSMQPAVRQVPRPPTKVQLRNPPPPPMKKPSPPPPPVKSQHYSLPQESIQKQAFLQQKMLAKQIEVRVPQKLVQGFAQVSPSSQTMQKSDNKSFAPPSFPTNIQDKKPLTIPPPPNRNMKDFLNKKLAGNKQIPKPPTRSINQSMISENIADSMVQSQIHGVDLTEDNFEDYGHKNLNRPVASRKNQPRRPKMVQIDEEYSNQLTQNNTQGNVNTKKPINRSNSNMTQTINPINFIGQWMGSPQLTLKQLVPELQEVIQFYILKKHLTLPIVSTNTTFTFLLGEFIHAFMINNKVRLTEDQKSVVQAIGLNFFYSNATQFSDIFLISLIKMGDQYLYKYEKALQDKLEAYLKRLILFKNLLLTEEIDTFVNFCLDRHFVNETNFLSFMMLACENSQLLTLVSNTQIQDLKYSLSILSFCKLNLKNKSLMGLYLKLISNLAPQFTQNGLVQRILSHLKQLEVPQSFYQFSKQLKLRLLKNYDSQKQVDDKQAKFQNGTFNNASNSEAGNDKGLFGYFSINKAIDKIKISTEKALATVEKQVKPVEEEKKDDIVYDPVKKRYVINGKIPEDENYRDEQAQEAKQKVPPPKPIGQVGQRKKVPPPPMHGKKNMPRLPARYV